MAAVTWTLLGSGYSARVYKKRTAEGKVTTVKSFWSNVPVGKAEEEGAIQQHVAHDRVVRVLGVSPRTLELEFMPTTIGRLLTTHGGKIPRDSIQFLIRQLCEGVQHTHACGVVHLDLKPSNLFLAGDGSLKIGDWGSAKRMDTAGHVKVEVSTPDYCAPEILLNSPTVTSAVDVWSIGCVMAEFFTHKNESLFPGGSDQMVTMWVSYRRGQPNWPGADALPRYHWFEQFKIHPVPPLTDFVHGIDAEALELLEGMLAINPHQRWDLHRILHHPFLQSEVFST